MTFFQGNWKNFLFVIMGTVGLLILFNCINLGQDKAAQIILQNGGAMDTSQYLIIVEQAINIYKIIGTILLTLSGVGLLIELLKYDNGKIISYK